MFERKGLQTATILTDTFRRPGDAMARVQGFTDFRYAVMTHPISSLNPEQIRARAREALPEVLVDSRTRRTRAGRGECLKEQRDGHRHA